MISAPGVLFNLWLHMRMQTPAIYCTHNVNFVSCRLELIDMTTDMTIHMLPGTKTFLSFAVNKVDAHAITAVQSVSQITSRL